MAVRDFRGTYKSMETFNVDFNWIVLEAETVQETFALVFMMCNWSYTLTEGELN